MEQIQKIVIAIKHYRILQNFKTSICTTPQEIIDEALQQRTIQNPVGERSFTQNDDDKVCGLHSVQWTSTGKHSDSNMWISKI